MGGIARDKDWSATPLGDPSTWPQSLRTTVSTCLSSRFPILVWWGKELVEIYNDAYMPILGDKHPRALGQRGRDCWPEIWHIIGPMLEGVIERGEATWSEDQMLPLARHGFVEECYFTFSYSPIRDESGGVGGVFTAVTETTERVLAERRLETLRELAAGGASARTDEEACAQAAAVLERNASDVPFAIVYLVDADERCVTRVRAVGLPADTSAAPRAIARDEAGALWPAWEAIATRRTIVVEDLGARCGALPGGPWGEAASRAVVLPIARPGQDLPYGVAVFGTSPRRPLDASYEGFLALVAGHVATAIANARAHQEERRRAEALAELDRAKTRFFSDVSHELRTPLALVLAPLEDIEQLASLAPDDREKVALARRSALRLLRLVNTLLDFSRIEAGRAEACFEDVDLADLTRDLASSFRSAAERAGIRLVIDCERPPRPTFVDVDMWEKIVLNLVSNGSKHTFEGAITVRLRGDDERVVLTVEDTGVGIPEHELPRIFERFYRVRDARSRSHEGTGIGLALVRELVRLHAGTIRVESTVDRGTTFFVELPAGTSHLPADRVRARRTLARTATGAQPYVEEAIRWIAPRARHPVDAADAPTAAEVGRARVLLADDNADMRDYLTRLLSERWDVEALPDGAAALAAALERPPSLVLADVMMPELDGFALLRALKSNRRTRSVPVVLLSARAGEEATVEGLAAGADDYLVKPFSARELVARVAANLAASRVRAEENDRKDAFLAMLGHELRNPLAALSMAVQSLARRPERRERALALAERQVAHMARLLDDLLEASRLARGAIELRRERVHVGAAIRSALDSVRPLVERKRHVVRERLTGEDACVDADPTRLEQILTNVLTNAAKYQDPGGEIAVESVCEGGSVVVRVRDRGVGVAPELLGRIFDPFVQADQPLDRRDGGLGIGLTLVQSLVELHGGTVCARSEGPGRGCEIEIRLPLLAPQPSACADAAAAPSADARAARRVLVVDDNVDAAEMTRDWLVDHGYQVTIATDGLDALDLLARERPDVALLDLGLPRLDGYALARRARELPGLARTRLVALSGYGSAEHRRESRAAGFDAHLVKPVAPSALLALLEDDPSGAA